MARASANARVDLSKDSDGERPVDLFRKLGAPPVKRMDIAPSHLNEQQARKLNISTRAYRKMIDFLEDVVLAFAGGSVVGAAVIGWGVVESSWTIIIAGGAGGLLSYLSMIVAQHKMDKIKDIIRVSDLDNWRR